MGRRGVFLLGLPAWLLVLGAVAAQPPLGAPYDVLAAERLFLLKKQEGVLKQLGQHSDRTRAYEERNRRVTAAIAVEVARPHPTGKFAADDRSARLARLRVEVSWLQREWTQLDHESRDLRNQLNAVRNALARVQTAMAALKAAPPPPE
jgi:hypothetical protein